MNLDQITLALGIPGLLLSLYILVHCFRSHCKYGE